MARYRRTLRAAHPLRLKLSARAVLGYSLFPGLETVKAPVAIAYAESDTLHGGAEVRSDSSMSCPAAKRSSAPPTPTCTPQRWLMICSGSSRSCRIRR